MKIALVCPYNIKRGGGVKEVILATQKELQRRGHIVKVITPKVEDPDPNLKDIIYLGDAYELNLGATTIDLSANWSDEEDRNVKELLETERFDIIHFNEPWIPLISYQLLFRSEAVNIATFHATSPDRSFWPFLRKFIYPYSSTVFDKLDKVIAVSESPLEYINRIYSGPIEIIPNGIDLQVYDQNKYSELKKYKDGKLNILFLGRLDKRKGVIHLVQAFNKLKNPNYRLLIAGKGEQMETIASYIKKYRVQNVEMLGYVSQELKCQLIKTCDIFCSPAMYGESMGVALLEAMAFGKAIIAGDNPGYRSLLKDRSRLFMVNPEDIDDFAFKLDLLCKDKELRELMADWGKAEIKNYAYNKIVDQLEKVYRSALSNTKHKSPLAVIILKAIFKTVFRVFLTPIDLINYLRLFVQKVIKRS